MAIAVTLPPTTRKRGNPNWGRPIPAIPALATEFELRVRQLQLTAGMYTSSHELRAWCERDSAAQSLMAEYDRAYGDTGCSPRYEAQTRKPQLGASNSARSRSRY